jgi:hypothetical protein
MYTVYILCVSEREGKRERGGGERTGSRDVVYVHLLYLIPQLIPVVMNCAQFSWMPLRNFKDSRAIVQAVSRRLPTAAARVRTQVRSCGICGRQSDTGLGFLRVFRFPLPVLIPSTAPQSPSSINRGWYSRPVVADVPSGLSLTPPQETEKKKLNIFSA